MATFLAPVVVPFNHTFTNPLTTTSFVINFGAAFAGTPGGRAQQPAGSAGSGMTGAYLCVHNASYGGYLAIFAPSGAQDFIPPMWRRFVPLRMQDASVTLLLEWSGAYPRQEADSVIQPIIYDPAEVTAGLLASEGPITRPMTRTVSVPMSADQEQAEVVTGSIALPGAGVAANLATLIPVTGGRMFFYVHLVVTALNGANGAAGTTSYALQADVQDIFNASLGGGFPRVFYRSRLPWPVIGAGSLPDKTDQPTFAYTFKVNTGVANFDHFAVQFLHIASSAMPPTAVDFTVVLNAGGNDADALTPVRPGLISNQVLDGAF